MKVKGKKWLLAVVFLGGTAFAGHAAGFLDSFITPSGSSGWDDLSRVRSSADRENLIIWQPGDIVTFSNPDHIAILSDKRNSDGVPYLLHNQGPWASEGDDFMYWYERGITGHFRYPSN